MEEVKVVLITGGSSGIGAATARILAQNGMKVYAGSRRGTLQEQTPGVVPVKLDVNDAAATEAVVKRILSEEGRLDLLKGHWIRKPAASSKPITSGRSRPSRPACRSSGNKGTAASSPSLP